MKRGFILFVLIMFLLTNPVLGLYNCSDSQDIIKDIDEIKVGSKKYSNGLGIAVVKSDDISAFARFTATIFVDAERIILTNETQDVELKTGDYAVALINASVDSAYIKVGSSHGTIVAKETTSIGNLDLSLTKILDTTPGQQSVEAILGYDTITLSNDKNPIQIITINSTEYLIELFAASDTDATFIVKKCKSGDIIEVNDTKIIIAEEVNNTVIENNATVENVTTQNITQETPEEVDEPVITKECEKSGVINLTNYCDSQNKIQGLKKGKESCMENYECRSDKCENLKCKKLGVFTRMWNWIKKQFA